MHTYTQVKIARTLTRTYKVKLASYIYNDIIYDRDYKKNIYVTYF